MKEYWSQRVRDLEPYTPGEQPKEGKWIKLNTNENPYPPSPMALQAIRESADSDLRLYPDPMCTKLRQTAANCWGVKPEQVFCGNGSDEVLAFAFQAFFNPDRPVVFPQVTYSFYPVYISYFALTSRQVPLNPNFTVPLEQMRGGNGGVVLPNPNAPTGISISRAEVEELVEANPDVVVILDEAYVDFGAQSAVTLIEDFPNLLVIRTLSKSRALAGLRVGFALGQENLICALQQVRDSFNSYTVDRVAQAAAVASLLDMEYFELMRQKVIETRERTASALRKKGFTVCPSTSNFLFAEHPEKSGERIFQELRKRGILVRRWDLNDIQNWLRISMGTDQEMDIFLDAMDEILTGEK